MAIPKPLILDDCDVKIGGQSLKCLTNHVELTPDVSTTTVTTMCGEADFPGVVKWSLVCTFYQSFEADATEEVLSAAVDGGVPVPFEILPFGSAAVSATNPKWTGDVIPIPYSPVNGDAGDAATIDIEWSLVGEPTKTTTP